MATDDSRTEGDTGSTTPFERMRGNFREAAIVTAVFYFLFIIIILLENVDSVLFGSSFFDFGLAHVALVLVPFVALLFVSGELEEIRGPGGMSFLLQSEAEEEIQTSTETQLEYETDVVLEKGEFEGEIAEEPNEERVRELAERIRGRRPTTLSFQIGKQDFYDEDAIRLHIQLISRISPEFKYILFNNTAGEFEGVIRVSDFVYLHSYAVDDMVRSIETGEILTRHQVVQTSIDRDSTNRRALEQMAQQNEDMLGVVDSDRKFIGVLEEEELTRKLFLSAIRGHQHI